MVSLEQLLTAERDQTIFCEALGLKAPPTLADAIETYRKLALVKADLKQNEPDLYRQSLKRFAENIYGKIEWPLSGPKTVVIETDCSLPSLERAIQIMVALRLAQASKQPVSTQQMYDLQLVLLCLLANVKIEYPFLDELLHQFVGKPSADTKRTDEKLETPLYRATLQLIQLRQLDELVRNPSVSREKWQLGTTS